MEGQDLDLEPAGLNGPRTFVASSGTLGVKFFVFTNNLQDDDLDPSRGAMTLQLSFTAVPKGKLFNLAAILLTTHMRICGFLNHGTVEASDIWLYCSNPTVPDCVHISLYCGGGESDIQCSSPASSLASAYGISPALCDQFDSNNLNPNNLTNEQKTWWRLSDTGNKIEDQSSKMLMTQFIVMAFGGLLAGIFASIFIWRFFYLFCGAAGNEPEVTDEHKKGEEQT